MQQLDEDYRREFGKDPEQDADLLPRGQTRVLQIRARLPAPPTQQAFAPSFHVLPHRSGETSQPGLAGHERHCPGDGNDTRPSVGPEEIWHDGRSLDAPDMCSQGFAGGHGLLWATAQTGNGPQVETAQAATDGPVSAECLDTCVKTR